MADSPTLADQISAIQSQLDEVAADITTIKAYTCSVSTAALATTLNSITALINTDTGGDAAALAAIKALLLPTPSG